MPRVIGIDPGTVNIDICGLDDGRLFLDRTFPTAEALKTPTLLVELLESSGPLDLVAGPSGYGLPLTLAHDLTETDLRLACLAAEHEPGGIGGLRALIRLLARSTLPVVLTPGVIHFDSVPRHRKVNRIDMGTADKVCAVALALRQHAARLSCRLDESSFILLELGGAFTAAIAVQNGRIVDGVGGTSGPLGLRGSGALDGEVAFLASAVSKQLLFGGGADAIAGMSGESAEALARPATVAGRVAWAAYVESAVKAVVSLAVSAWDTTHIVLSGRLALVEGVPDEFQRRLAKALHGSTVSVLRGFATVAKQAAQGAALVADGLAGGASAPLVEVLGIRQASGTVLDHLDVISPDAARRRLGIDSAGR
jgi:predicted butyrate kinase (DUF1464 family)